MFCLARCKSSQFFLFFPSCNPYSSHVLSQSCEYPLTPAPSTLHHLHGEEHKFFHGFCGTRDFAWSRKMSMHYFQESNELPQVLKFWLRVGKGMAEKCTLTAGKCMLLAHQQQETEHQNLPRQELSILRMAANRTAIYLPPPRHKDESTSRHSTISIHPQTIKRHLSAFCITHLSSECCILLAPHFAMKHLQVYHLYFRIHTS